LTCKDCGKKGHHVVEDREQGVFKGKEWEELKKCKGYAKKEKEKAVYPTEEKAQPSGAWVRDLEGAAKEGGCQRESLENFQNIERSVVGYLY